MQTLHQLLSGELNGTKILKLSCELTVFPIEIFELANTLEILDLSNNKLSQLPENFKCLKKLKIAFFSENDFTEFPSILNQCESLTMIGFKSNKINKIPEVSFPKQLQWLILTNNCIEEIPKSIGNCLKLQKVALAGNKLKTLPREMANCINIELLRISANNINTLPSWLFTLPKLAWLAYSGNPCSKIEYLKNEISLISWNELTIEKQLGEGASGVIYEAIWKANSTQKKVAIKVFKGEVTSDGFSEDEINACISAGFHKNLVSTIGKIENHPTNKSALVFELIPTSYKNLGNPPNFETCTRDTFDEGELFSIDSIITIAKSITSVLVHLHSKGIMHGDLYAHNTLINKNACTILGDFGAATLYDISEKNAPFIERLDVRAFGCLLEDLLKHTNLNQEFFLFELKAKCMNDTILNRPNFKQIMLLLNEMPKT